MGGALTNPWAPSGWLGASTAGLTQNGMDAQAAKQFVNGLKDQGPTGASVLRNLAASFFDERLNTATGKKYGK